MATLNEIEVLTSEFALQRADIILRVGRLQEAIDALKRYEMPGIRAALGRTMQAKAALTAALDESAALFERPRTRVFAGIKVGYQKEKGTVEIPDEEKAIARIRALVPEEQAELLIRVKESIDKNAVRDLTVADIKRFGINITSDTDVIVIKPVDGDVEKIVNALLADATEETEASAA